MSQQSLIVRRIMSEGSNVDNVVPFKKRRRALTNPAALQFLREASDESGVVRVASRAELAAILGWERTRASKALTAWERAKKITMNTDADTGKIIIRVMPDRREKEREKAPGNSRENKRETSREKRPRETRESVQNSGVASDTYQSSKFGEITPQSASANAQISPSQNALLDREISRSKSRFWRWRRRGNANENFTVRDRAPLTWNDAVTWLIAVALTAVAASFSISGMVVLFPGAPAGARIMGIVMEAAKLAIAGWLGGGAQDISWLNRGVLRLILLGLMSINALGLYSQLVAAHVGHHGELVASNEANDGRLAAQIEVQDRQLANVKERLAQLDQIVKAAVDRGKPNTANNIKQEQNPQRVKLASEYDAAAKESLRLKTERAESKARGHVAETEAAPIQYVAQVLHVRAGGEEVIRWFILLIVLCCDPCAVAMIYTRERMRQRRRAR
jgi:hypothetical protein